MLRSHSLPWQLHWLPDPSWGIPGLHSQSQLGTGDKEQPGTHRDIRAIPGWGLGSARLSCLGIPCSQLVDQGIRGCQLLWDVQSLQQEGLDGAGIAPKQDSDIFLSILLDNPVSPGSLLCDPAAPRAAGEMGILCAAGLCPISPSGKQEESISCCAQAQQKLAGHWDGLGMMESAVGRIESS